MDRLLMTRTGSSNLTATEAAGTNKVLAPPGHYKYLINAPVPAGTPTCVVTWNEAADGSTWAALNPQVTHTLSGSATAVTPYTGHIRVTKNPSSSSVAANVTTIFTVSGGSGNVWGALQCGLTPLTTSGWQDSP
jgi:hypothetical protein